jgi:hypothetical protein
MGNILQPPRGQMIKAWIVCCYECGDIIEVTAKDKAAAMKAIRGGNRDWSLGRDKRWRCGVCRPRRFGERIGAAPEKG